MRRLNMRTIRRCKGRGEEERDEKLQAKRDNNHHFGVSHHPSLGYVQNFSKLPVVSSYQCPLVHPAFCGLLRVALTLQRPPDLNSLPGIYDISTTKKARQLSWRMFYPPLSSGARQKQNAWTLAHDRSEIIHPSYWGSLVAPSEVFFSEVFTCPAFFCSANLQNISINNERFIQCYVCQSQKDGCPCCFELPIALKLHEVSYAPGDEPRVKLHTDLTTRSALMHDRHLRHAQVNILVKSIPCGSVVQFHLLSDAAVGHVHHLMRAASPHGFEQLLLLAVPGDRGLTSLTATLTPLSRYGLNGLNEASYAILFHGCHSSAWRLMRMFLRANVLTPLQATFPVMEISDYAPSSVPGRDAIQTSLAKTISQWDSNPCR